MSQDNWNIRRTSALAIRRVGPGWATMLTGMSLATLLIWVATIPFIDSEQTYVFDEALQEYVNQPGQSFRRTNEGYGITSYGSHGFCAINDIEKIATPLVGIWGDSFVEAVGVSDRYKMQSQLNNLLAMQENNELFAVGIGRAQRMVSDYYFLIPPYEQQFEFEIHYVLLASLYDITPNESSFLREPRLSFKRRSFQPRHQTIRRRLNEYQLHFLKEASYWFRGVDPATGIHKKMRFWPGPAPKNQFKRRLTLEERTAGSDLKSVFEFAVGEIQSCAEAPVVFVYAPDVPRVDGSTVTYEDPDALASRVLKEVCVERGVGYIDLTRDLIRLYEEHRIFARGFPNTVPSQGHFNRHGHRLLADALANDLKSRRSTDGGLAQ